MIPRSSPASSRPLHGLFGRPSIVPPTSLLGRPLARCRLRTASQRRLAVNRKAFEPHLNYSRSRDALSFRVHGHLQLAIHDHQSKILPLSPQYNVSNFPSGAA